jgi:hypothetical protein
LAASAVAASAASAATISYSYDDAAGYFDINRFDPSLGTLTGVKIDLQSVYDADIQVNSYDEEGFWVPARFDYSASIARTLKFGTLSMLVSYVGSGSVNLPRETFWSGFTVAGSTHQSYSGAAIDYFIGDEPFNPGDRSIYNISGNLVLLADGYGDWEWDDSGFYDKFRITYTYTPAGAGAVPEPMTWAMMLVGFGAIGHAVRRRRKIAVSFG